MVGKTVISDDEDELNVEEEEEEEVGYADPVQADEEEEEEEDEDEEDEEGQDEYEKDDFIVDDAEDEEEEDEDGDRESDDEKQKKKKKRKKRESERNYLLDEDDYELLQENDPRPKIENKKFKRLKKAQRDAEEERSGFSDEEELDGTGRRGQMAEERLKRSLFGDEGQPLEDQDLAEEDIHPEEEEDADIDEDEMADFIVDEDDVDEHGDPVRRTKLNKKKSRKSDIQSDQVLEGMEIFGDVEELIRQRKQSLAKMHRYEGSTERGERRLEHEFEPIILSEKYMTEKDDRIREIDIPERMQLSEESTGFPPTDEFSLKEETTWIYSQLASDMAHLFSKKASTMTEEGNELSVKKDDIMRFLELTHVQKLDVPFISIYRKEECMSLLEDPEQQGTDYDDNNNSDRKSPLKWHKVLWAVQDLDKKWLLLQKRKNALQSYYDKRFDEESRRDHNEARLNLNQQLFESITDSLKTAESEREVEDVDAKFNLHFPPGEVGVDEGQFKRPKRKSQYNICSKAGLWEVTNKFGYSSEQFGLLISLQNMRLDELEDARETPEEMASRFTCMMFESPQEVLKGARHMAAVEISCEPCVRKYVRSIFMENAVVSTNPTSEGNVAIDAFHQYGGVKWLKDKPVNRFEDAQWLLIQKAEEEKLLQVTIKLPERVLEKLISDSNDYYVSDGVSKSAQLWNEQRKLILQGAFSNFLLPSMEKEARTLLTSRAKHWLATEYGSLLWNKVSIGPYHRKETENNSDEEAAPRVMACCWGPGKPATTFVMLDSSGEVQDVLYAGSLNLRGQSIQEKQRKTNDQQRVQKFMVDNQPDVVVLGAVNLSCARLKEDIYEIIFKMVEDNPRDVYEMDNLNIVYGDESLPHLYENSRISSDQLPAQSGIVKRAVALGRYLQNPLAMVATLCGPGKEILSWKLSQLESFLTPDEKYDMIEQIMVDVTNQVGLDVNLAASHEWLFAPLQFISGLGPRKAASLQRSLVRSGAIFTRKDLLTAHGLGKKVFVNAVGFLRVRRSGLAASSSQFIDLLDDTRIHPESYGLAQDLAKDVYNLDVEDEANEDDDLLEMAIEHVREKPQLLRAVQAYEYAEQKNRQNKKETLNDIRLELIHGFQDWRKPYVEPNPDEEFCMISGETEETLFEGKIVQVTVRRVQPQRANCVLDSGLNGMLTKEDYTDNWRDVNDLTEKLREGDMLTCRIKSIQKNRYQVFLSCRESDMRSERHQNTQNVDPYYHEDRSTINTEQDKARKEKELAKRHFKPRMIVHPRFQNISADEAVEFLSDKEPGECVIRPSSRGPSYLTLTLKIYDGVYAHKDIVEGGKEHKDINSLLRIGKTLKIGDDTFEDLDEVIDRYVDPLVTHLKTMLSYRKFRKGNKAEVDELLRIEKSEYPMRIVYGFGIFHEHPGTFILTYIRSSNPHHEYIGLYPKGFKFRKRMFEDLDRLVSYFQRHIDDPHDSAPSIQSVAAMVPMKSPGVGGSSGFGGGWGGDSNDGKRRGGQDRDGNSGRGLRGGRGDYRGGNNQDGHPRSYGEGGRGRGRGRGRDSYGGGRGNSSSYDNQGPDHGSKKWDSKEGDNQWGSFPGAKVQKSPGREAFPTSRGSSGVEAGGGSSSRGDADVDPGSSGWGSNKESSEQNGGGW